MQRAKGAEIDEVREIVKDYFKASLFLFVPNVCNAKCEFCYVKPTYALTARLPAVTLNRTSTFLALVKECGFDEIRLTGGEPTVFENLAELLGAFSAHGLRYTILTNGLRLSANAELLSRIPPAGLTVSVHSLARASGVFGVGVDTYEILAEAGRLARSGMPVTVSFVLGVSGIVDTLATLEAASAFGIRSAKLICVNDAGAAEGARAAFENAVLEAQGRKLGIDVRITDLLETSCLLRRRGFLAVTMPDLTWNECCATVGVTENKRFSAGTLQGVCEMIRSAYQLGKSVDGLPCSPSIGACPISLVDLRRPELLRI